MNNNDVPRINLTFWQRFIIALEDAHILPGRYWFTWYDPFILLPLIASTILLLVYLPQADIDRYPGTAFLFYLMCMAVRHYVWLENYAKEILDSWGKKRGYTLGKPKISEEKFLAKINWQFKKYLYSIQKEIQGGIILSIFGADFEKKVPWWRRRNKKDKMLRTLTFAHIKFLPHSLFSKVMIIPRIKNRTIFPIKGLKFFSNITGVNEFDRRFKVFAENPQEALRFLNPIVILSLLHVTLPHEISILGDDILISSNRHFTRRRVLDELDTISTAIIDAHGGVLENDSWEKALEYFHNNPYKIGFNYKI